MRVAVVGTGLMGASVALAARRRGDDVSGWDPDPAALAAAVARGALDAAASPGEAVAAADLVAAAGAPRFVGGHPICGAESRGAENASADLFRGATWFLTPTAQTDPAAHRLVHGFAADLGATPVAIAADAHDRLVSLKIG